jgi:hypothetical protein
MKYHGQFRRLSQFKLCDKKSFLACTIEFGKMIVQAYLAHRDRPGFRQQRFQHAQVYFGMAFYVDRVQTEGVV